MKKEDILEEDIDKLIESAKENYLTEEENIDKLYGKLALLEKATLLVGVLIALGTMILPDINPYFLLFPMPALIIDTEVYYYFEKRINRKIKIKKYDREQTLSEISKLHEKKAEIQKNKKLVEKSSTLDKTYKEVNEISGMSYEEFISYLYPEELNNATYSESLYVKSMKR